MIVCVNPKADDYDETMLVMRFAEMTQEVEVARPVDRPICGLTAGRRHRNRVFRDEMTRRMDEKGGPGSAVDDTALLDQLMESLPALPRCELLDPADDQTLPRLMEVLERRHRVRQMMTEQFNNSASTLKSMLQQFDSQINSKETFLHEQRSKLSEKEKVINNQKSELERLEKKSKTLEYKIDILQKTTNMYEQDKRSLQQELETREQRLHRELTEKKRMEQRMQGMVTDTKHKWEKEFEAAEGDRDGEQQQHSSSGSGFPSERPEKPERPSRERDHMRSASPSPLQDFNQTPSHQNRANVRAAQDPHSTSSFFSTTTTFSSSTCSSSSSVYPSVASCITDWEHKFPVDSSSKARQLGTPQCSSRTPGPYQGASSVGRRRGQRWAADTEAPAPTVYGLDLEAGTRTAPPVRPTHRRSHSAGGEKWVDHKPASNLDLDTVMQPIIPNSIKVSTPNEKALSKCQKYVLRHQELASDGEIETKLIKGNVFKTRGGGQAVQFTDIETLKQECAMASSRKRHSGSGDGAAHMEDIENRAPVPSTSSNLGYQKRRKP
ncbi:hypothetical protein F7725_026569 [Dissostichus mawsoni]|uniref:Kinesin-like protein KIF23 n=1 Tax=Dissostichus mawsoni TaxID=36200 RepID=A0A7J5X7C7_DISMA|nr:hypothetical protein F7725_026569 [Dissostichus mawsoni]